MLNLKHVEDQPRWRVAAVAYFAKMMGVFIYVEGIPFGSNRLCKIRGKENCSMAQARATR